MTTIYDNIFLDDDDVFAKTTCLFKKYDGSSSISSCSRSSRSSEISSRLKIPDSDNERRIRENNATKPPSGNTRRYDSRIARDFSSSSLENSPTEVNEENNCELCGSTIGRYSYHACKRDSLQTNSSFSSQDNNSARYLSYWGSPSYERGSWRRRFRAERNTEIDLTPLLDVLKRIDNMNTSMGIPAEEYTKNIPKRTGYDEADNILHMNNKRNVFQDAESNSKYSYCASKPSSHNPLNDGNYVQNNNDCINEKELALSETNYNSSEISPSEDKCNVESLYSNQNVDDNNNKYKYDSDSEFEKMFDDALNYNMKTDESRKIKSACDKKKHGNSSFKHIKPFSNDTSPIYDAYIATQLLPVNNNWSSKGDSSDHQIETKTTRKRRKSKGYLNRSFLARSRKDSTEKDKVKVKDNSSKNVEVNLSTINTKNQTPISNLSESNAKQHKIQSKDLTFEEETKRVKHFETGVNILRSGCDRNRDNISKTINSDKDYNKKLDHSTEDIPLSENVSTIDRIPRTYEEFNKSLEEASINGAMKRSSIEKRPVSVKVVVTDAAEECRKPKSRERRRSSVSHLTAFWENKLSATKQDNTDNHLSDTDQSDENDDHQEISEFDFPQRLKKTVQGNVLLQENATGTETGTDEDEKFRRIQSKLENMCKQSSRMNIRRKSILKNKGETSSFLTEFLTVPSARKRNSDSESGSNSAQSIKPEQLAKRRVSFQSSVNLDKTSSSEKDSQSEEDGEETSKHGKEDDVNVILNVDTGRNSLKSYCSNGRVENAENEHIVWREWETAESNGTSDVTITTQRKYNNFDDDKNKLKPSENSYPNLILINGDNYSSNGKIEIPKTCNTIALNDTNKSPKNPVVLNQILNEQECTNGHITKNMSIKTKESDTFKDTNSYFEKGFDECQQVQSEYSQIIADKLKSDTLNDNFDEIGKANEADEVPKKRNRRSKLFSIAGEDDEEQASLLDNHVELDSSDSTDIELSWRTRGYSADFYMSRKSTTGSELIDKFRKVLRKKSKDNNSTKRRRYLKDERF